MGAALSLPVPFSTTFSPLHALCGYDVLSVLVFLPQKPDNRAVNLAAESPEHLAEPGGLRGARLSRPVQKKKAFPIFGGNHLTDRNPFGGEEDGWLEANCDSANTR